jgi:hypothetical protein
VIHLATHLSGAETANRFDVGNDTSIQASVSHMRLKTKWRQRNYSSGKSTVLNDLKFFDPDTDKFDLLISY